MEHIEEEVGQGRQGHIERPGILGCVKELDRKQSQDFIYASFMAFSWVPATQAAHELINNVIEILLEKEQRLRVRRKADQSAFEHGVASILSDLFIAYTEKHSRWCYRSLHNDTFIGTPVGAVTFRKIINLMQELSFVERQKGGNVRNPLARVDSSGCSTNLDIDTYVPGWASRFCCGPELLELANNFGITPDNIREHFTRTMPHNPIVLRASSSRKRFRKIRGRRMKIEKTDKKAQRLRQEVQGLNDYLGQQKLEGGNFTGYYRIFNEGNREDFDWNMGARLYCTGEGNYQQMSKNDRLDMTINGEPVVEIDLTASYLYILYTKLNEPLPDREDFYEIPGLSRDIVKAWMTATLGFDKFHIRWPVKTKQRLAEKGIETGKELTMPRVEEKILEAFTPLRNWPNCEFRWYHLMYWESEAISNTLLTLKDDHDIPAYSVHDSIIVPASAEEVATKCLINSYEKLFGITPKLKVNRPPRMPLECSQKLVQSRDEL